MSEAQGTRSLPPPPGNLLGGLLRSLLPHPLAFGKEGVTMALYKRGKVYWYSFVFMGRRIQETTRATDRRAAQQIESARKTALAKGEADIHERRPARLLKEFEKPFVDQIRLDCKDKPKTITFYEQKLRHLLSAWGTRRLDQIDEEAIEKYKSERQRQQTRYKRVVSTASINRELATLSRLLRIAYERQLIRRVPHIRRLGGEQPRDFVLSQTQEPLYLAAVPDLLRDVATVLIDTGLRVGELLSLEWPQVSLDAPQGKKFPCLTIKPMYSKNGKGRTVPMTQRAVSVLRRWRGQGAQMDGVDLVFHLEDGRKIDSTRLNYFHRRTVATLNASASLQPKFPRQFCLHSLRHTYGTRLGESGIEAFRIRDLMGHSSVTVSQRYVHPSSDSLESAFERMLQHQVVTVSATLGSGSSVVRQ